MVKRDLKVRIGNLELKNPVMVASGTFGCGEEFADLVDINRLGAIVTKSVTLRPRQGNPPPRIVETAAGILNSIGLQNEGVEDFLKNKLRFLNKVKSAVIVSIAGETPEEYAELARRLGREDAIDGLEVNISCPNVKCGLEFSAEPKLTFELVSLIRKSTAKAIIVKLSPNVADITETARAAEEAQCDSVSLVNTFIGMSINIETKMPGLGNVVGGLSGPAIKPLALKMVWEVARSVRLPVIGMGGIMDYADALEFLIAGASAVQIGTANFVSPNAAVEVVDGIETYMRSNGIKDIRELIGCLKG